MTDRNASRHHGNRRHAVRELAACPESQFGTRGKPGDVDPARVDDSLRREIVDDAAQKAHVIDVLSRRVSAAVAGIPVRGDSSEYAAGSVRVDDDHVMALGDAVHLRHRFHELAVFAAAMKQNEKRISMPQEKTSRRAGWNVNEIAPESITRLN